MNGKDLPWELPVASNYPEKIKYKNSKVVDYILLAEFDINTGSTLRHQYPNTILGYADDWFAENMLPEGVHNREFDWNYMFLNRNGCNIGDFYGLSNTQDSEDMDNFFLYGVNIVKTKYDSSVRRGAIVKAIAFFSRHHFVESFRDVLEEALESYFENPSLSVLEELYESLNKFDLNSIPSPCPITQSMMRRGVNYNRQGTIVHQHCPQRWNYHSQYINYNNKRFDTVLPIYRTIWEFGNINISRLIKTFGDATMKIFHGIITNQRILFVGYNHSTSDIAQMVLSAVAMVSPPIPRILVRTFAYANLSDLSFLEVPGYIAGVTNPMFQQRDSWWDILCILDLPNGTGTVQTADEKRLEENNTASTKHSNRMSSSHTSSAQHSQASANTNNSSQTSSTSSRTTQQLAVENDHSHIRLDQKFITAVLSGVSVNLDEHWVQRQFYNYTMDIVYLAQDIAQGKKALIRSKRLLKNVKIQFRSNIVRASYLATTKEFSHIPNNPWTAEHTIKDINNVDDSINPSVSSTTVFGVNISSSSESSNPVTEESDNNINKCQCHGEILKDHILRLQCEQSFRFIQEIILIFKDLDSCLVVERDVQGLLTLLPESRGGLFLIASPLFHGNPVMKFLATKILHKVSLYKSTRPALVSLGSFFHSSFARQLQSLQDGTLEREAVLFEQTTSPVDIAEMNALAAAGDQQESDDFRSSTLETDDASYLSVFLDL